VIREVTKRSLVALTMAGAIFGAFTVADRVGHGLGFIICISVCVIVMQQYAAVLREKGKS
jgi:hypothetical protein